MTTHVPIDDSAVARAVAVAQQLLVECLADVAVHDVATARLVALFAQIDTLEPELIAPVLCAVGETAGPHAFRVIYLILAAYQLGRARGASDAVGIAILVASARTQATRAA